MRYVFREQNVRGDELCDKRKNGGLKPVPFRLDHSIDFFFVFFLPDLTLEKNDQRAKGFLS